jgi:anti-sigma regulatory factor (Ser/Thr protein kinase)
MTVSTRTTEPITCHSCTVQIVFDLPEETGCITYLRKKARAMIETLQIAREDVDDIEFIICELATNVYRHAKDDDYHVNIALGENRVIITVVDKGQGFTLENIPPPATQRPDTASPDHPMRFGGLGLPMIQSLAEKVEVTPNPTRGMTVRVIKNLQPTS